MVRRPSPGLILPFCKALGPLPPFLGVPDAGAREVLGCLRAKERGVKHTLHPSPPIDPEGSTGSRHQSQVGTPSSVDPVPPETWQLSVDAVATPALASERLHVVPEAPLPGEVFAPESLKLYGAAWSWARVPYVV